MVCCHHWNHVLWHQVSLELPKAKVPAEGESPEEKEVPKDIRADGGERIFDNIIQLI